MSLEIGYPIEGKRVKVAEKGEEAKLEKTPMEPGVVYEIQALVEPLADKPVEEVLYDVIKRVRHDYPGIIINYLKITRREDGRYEVVIQVFDDPAVPWKLIVILIILAILGTIIYFNLYMISEIVEKAPGVNILLIALAVFLAGYGIARVIEATRERKSPR